MFKKLWRRIATLAGDTWWSNRLCAVWPYPAVIVGAAHSKFTWTDYRNFTEKLRVGDMLLMTSTPYFGSNMAIPGAFKHLAVYTGEVSGVFDPEVRFINRTADPDVKTKLFSRTVTHAVSEGVKIQDLGEVLFHADYVMAVRPTQAIVKQDEIRRAALSQVNKPYDFMFNPDNRRAIFCTELGKYCLGEVGFPQPPTTDIKTSLFGKTHPVPLADNFCIYEPVVCSESCFSHSFMSRGLTEQVSRAITGLR
jgi:hypothetical protein